MGSLEDIIDLIRSNMRVSIFGKEGNINKFQVRLCIQESWRFYMLCFNRTSILDVVLNCLKVQEVSDLISRNDNYHK